ncbi:MAG: BT_3928 family protein [Rikenellaceae bacterium]
MSREVSRRFRNIAHICRLTVGLIFIISGFVKVIDPWGTALKVNEYLTIYGLEWAMPASMVLSIWICGAEMMMGCMLSFKVRIQLVSIFALISTTLFTVMTLLGATIFHIEDCGCFGEAIQLTPWQTFFKNLILLPMATIVFLRYKGRGKVFYFKRSELATATSFFFLTMGLGAYCYMYLPLIDFLPYKVGVNLSELIGEAKNRVASSNIETILIYRNIESGELQEFKIDDKEWQDSARWEWVESKSTGSDLGDSALISEFAIYNNKGRDYTTRLLTAKGVQHFLVVANRAELSDKCLENMNAFIAQAKKNRESVVCITSDIIERDNSFLGVRCYNLDKVNRKALLRAKSGVVTLKDGVIVRKSNCRNMM